jgi:protein gp37
MAENSKIEWTDHTFNAWTGCTKVSPACDHCYAESWAKRSGVAQWGAHPRRRTSVDYWKQPIKWNRIAERDGIRRKVFCCSLADVFDNQAPVEWRTDLWRLIRETPNLDWLLLTKRPQNISKMLPGPIADRPWPWPNVWLGTTVENQDEANRRIPHLLAVPATVKFLSCEPLLGPIRFSDVPGFNRVSLSLSNWWVIAGGESGPGARSMHPDWIRSLRDQCLIPRVPFFLKQWGEWAHISTAIDGNPVMERIGKKRAGAMLDGREWREFPRSQIRAVTATQGEMLDTI